VVNLILPFLRVVQRNGGVARDIWLMQTRKVEFLPSLKKKRIEKQFSRNDFLVYGFSFQYSITFDFCFTTIILVVKQKSNVIEYWKEKQYNKKSFLENCFSILFFQRWKKFNLSRLHEPDVPCDSAISLHNTQKGKIKLTTKKTSYVQA